MTVAIIPGKEAPEFTRGCVLFDEMRLLPVVFDDDYLHETEVKLRAELQECIDWWIERVPEDALVYEALTAISISYNQLAWMPGVVVECIKDNSSKREFMRAAQSFNTTDERALALLSSHQKLPVRT